MKKTLTTLAIMICGFATLAQTDVKLTINHFLGSEAFAFNKSVKNDLGHNFNLTRFEYYISGISVVHDGGKITNLLETYLLVQGDRKDTFLLGNIDATNIEAIHFSIGVDPFVNNEDPTQWPVNHALSPKSPSMHWGWSAGYRFVALEGKSGASLNQDFQIHALGNQNYFKIKIPTAAQKIGSALVVSLNADYIKSASGLSIENGLIEHSGFDEAAVCLRNFQTKVFTSLTGEVNTVSVAPILISEGFSILPNPSTSTINLVTLDNRLRNSEIEITDLSGKVIHQWKNDGNPKSFTLETTGLYLLRMRSDMYSSTSKFIIY